MEQVKDYLLGQADKLTAWIGVVCLVLLFFGFHSLLAAFLVALVALPQEQFSDFFKKRTQQLREMDKKL